MTALLHGRDSGSPRPGRDDGFAVVESARALGDNLPQQAGRTLWAPMLAMAVMGFAVAFVLGLFVGFLGVLSAITFAIARILGEFRHGGGQVQEAAGVPVQTLRMPATAKGMLAFMMMGMVAIAVPVVIHVVVGAGVGAGTTGLAQAEQALVTLEGVRRLGVGLYLFGITLGLATIVHVLRFQAVRIREVADQVTGPTL